MIYLAPSRRLTIGTRGEIIKSFLPESCCLCADIRIVSRETVSVVCELDKEKTNDEGKAQADHPIAPMKSNPSPFIGVLRLLWLWLWL